MTTTASSFYYLPPADNLITTATLSQSGTADANFPLSNLKSEFGWKMFRYAAAGADDTITADFGSAKQVTFCSIHFHNLDDAINVELRTSTDNFAANDALATTLTKNSPTFFSENINATIRSWRLKFVGTNASPIYIAKWVLGARSILTRMQRNGWQWSLRMPQAEGPSGLQVNQSLWEVRSVDLPFFYETIAERDEVHDMLTDSKWGEDPLVVVPDSEENVALYARAPNVWEIQRQIGGLSAQNGLYEFPLSITEDQHPIITK